MYDVHSLTCSRVPGAFLVSTAKVVRAALPAPLETPVGTDSWAPRVTKVALASKA